MNKIDMGLHRTGSHAQQTAYQINTIRKEIYRSNVDLDRVSRLSVSVKAKAMLLMRYSSDLFRRFSYLQNEGI
jgi:hypothetical protein